MVMPTAGDDLGQTVEVCGEPLHDGGKLDHDEVGCGRLSRRPSLRAEQGVELIEETSGDANDPAVSRHRSDER